MKSRLWSGIGIITLLSMIIVGMTSVAKAEWCEVLPAYTDYSNGKPSLIIYFPGGSYPNADKIQINFWNYWRETWEHVPHNKFGIDLDAPTNYTEDGWAYYSIATRWFSPYVLFSEEDPFSYETFEVLASDDPGHDAWDEDSLWEVIYCP